MVMMIKMVMVIKMVDGNGDHDGNDDKGDTATREYKAKSVQGYILGYPELTSLCYIPVSCLIACYALDKYFDDQNKNIKDTDVKKYLPKTLTQLYQMAIRVILWHHHPNTKDAEKVLGYSFSDDKLPDELKHTLIKLKEIAHTAMSEGNLIFPLPSQSSEIENCGLLGSSPDEFQLQCSFIHLTIQEFLTASYLADEIAIPEEIEDYLPKLEDANWDLVTQFLFGLLRDKFMTSMEKLKELSLRYVLHSIQSGWL